MQGLVSQQVVCKVFDRSVRAKVFAGFDPSSRELYFFLLALAVSDDSTRFVPRDVGVKYEVRFQLALFVYERDFEIVIPIFLFRSGFCAVREVGYRANFHLASRFSFWGTLCDRVIFFLHVKMRQRIRFPGLSPIFFALQCFWRTSFLFGFQQPHYQPDCDKSVDVIHWLSPKVVGCDALAGSGAGCHVDPIVVLGANAVKAEIITLKVAFEGGEACIGPERVFSVDLAADQSAHLAVWPGDFHVPDVSELGGSGVTKVVACGFFDVVQLGGGQRQRFGFCARCDAGGQGKAASNSGDNLFHCNSNNLSLR